MTINFRVTTYSHFFKVSHLTLRGRAVLDNFAKRFAQYSFEKVRGGGYTRTLAAMYAARTHDLSEYRFHINSLPEFLKHLENNYMLKEHYEWFSAPRPLPRMVSFEMIDGLTDRPHQVEPIEYLSQPEPVQKMLGMQTGKGKGYSFMRAMQNIGFAVLMLLKPMYLIKWQTEFLEKMKLTIEDIVIIRGSDQLIALLNLAAEGRFSSKIVMISNKTMQNWLKLYERYKDDTALMGYPIAPEQLCELLGAGLRGIDEVHQDFHLNFKFDLYTNVARGISLSATLVTEDAFEKQMYELAYPSNQRAKEIPLHKYVASYALFYELKMPSKVKCKGGKGFYSHIVYEEKTIMANRETLLNYLRMIENIIRVLWLANDYKKGERFAVFCATIEMCTIVTAFLRKRFSDLSIERFIGGDPESNLHDPDGRVTTMLSGGTARDISDLTFVLMAVSMTSIKGNIQGLGRLRELVKGPAMGKTPIFAYLNCRDIPKHMEYHQSKKELLQKIAATYKEVEMGRIV